MRSVTWQGWAPLRPAVMVAAFYGTIVVALLATHAWDPRFFATVGPEWERHDPGLRKQADGALFLAFATDPSAAARYHERRRTVRILYPLAAHVLALGRADLVGLTLIVVNLAAIALGTEIMHRLLERRGLSSWAALAYGAWCGLGLALLHDTSEPLAYLCALAGIDAQERGRPALAGLGFLGALLTRETALLLVAPFLLIRRDGRIARPGAAPLIVLAAWAVWLGVVALVGTGTMAPAHEEPAPPLVGYLATRPLDLPVTVLCVLAPALLVLGWTARELRRQPREPSLWAAALNALFVAWFPPRTAAILWHSGRLATGFVVATLLAAPLAVSAPRVWRVLTVLFAGSVGWTLAVTVRYLFWGVAP